MADDEIEALAVKHEAFGFGLVDAKGYTTHGFDPEGLAAFVREVWQEAARQERERTAKAQQDEIVNAAIEWYGSSHKDEPEHRLAMAVLRFKQALEDRSRSSATGEKG